MDICFTLSINLGESRKRGSLAFFVLFDALTADRPYRKAMPTTKAMSIIEEMLGNAIDPDCFKVLTEYLDELLTSAA